MQPSSNTTTEPVQKPRAAQVHCGQVIFYNAIRRFGFIRQIDPPGPDIFVHESGITSPICPLWPGKMVQFEIGHNDLGECAINVRVVKRLKE